MREDGQEEKWGELEHCPVLCIFELVLHVENVVEFHCVIECLLYGSQVECPRGGQGECQWERHETQNLEVEKTGQKLASNW